MLKIRKIRKKSRFLRCRKIENLREIDSKITILKLNKILFLLKLNVEIINKKTF